MHIMAIFGIVAIASIAGIFVLQEEGTQCDLINLTSEFTPSVIPMDGDTSVLNVEINSQQEFTEPIVIDIIPQNVAVLRIERDGLENLGAKYRYSIPQQKWYEGDTLNTTFNITATCTCKSGSWDIDIEVTVGENCTARETVPFIVGEQPSNGDGFCLGTELISMFVLFGATKRMHR